MQISCEKCSTAYVLDDKLVPAGGAPVQCTRCGHVFLAVPEDQARRDRSGTQLFGIHNPPETPASGGARITAPLPSGVNEGEPKTQVYGGGQRASTQMFGAVGSPPAPESNAAQPRASTQMFGAFGTPSAPAQPRASTQMFGAVGTPAAPEPAPQARASTQMFGAVGTPVAPEPAPQARASTQMFGAVGTPAAPAQPRASTQMFGAVGTPVAPAQPRASTQMFGAVGSPPPTPEPASAPRSTQMFGAVGSPPPPAEPASAPRSTQMFGAVGSPPPSAEPASAPRSTQMFGAVGTPQAHAPAAPPARSTQMFGAAKVTFGGAAESQRTHGAPIPTAEFETLPAEPARPYAKVELPPESAHLPVLPGPGEAASREASAASTRARKRSPGKVIALALGLVVVAAGGFGAYRFIDARRNAIAPELQVAREAAVGLLRRDDPESKERAVTQLTTVVGSSPAYVEAQADLVLALSLQLDDVKARVEAVQGAVGVLASRISRLENAQAPSDWQNRINVLSYEATTVRARLQPLTTEASRLEKQLETEVAKLAALEAARAQRPTATTQVIARARAVYHAIRGEPQSAGFVEQLRALDAQGSWADVAAAEYAANARVGDDVRTRSAEAMAALTRSDSTFLRPYVLAARLALESRDVAAAEGPLETALTLNPNHATATDLLEWVRAERALSSEAEQAAAPEAPPVAEPAPQ